MHSKKLKSFDNVNVFASQSDGTVSFYTTNKKVAIVRPLSLEMCLHITHVYKLLSLQFNEIY